LANPALDYKKCFLEPTTEWAKKHFSNLQERLNKDGMIKIGSRGFGAGSRLFEEMKQYFPDKKLAVYDKPLLIVHGTKDSKVAYGDAYEIYKQLDNPQKRFETIDGSEHGFHEEPYENQVTFMIADFIKDQL
jgi:pimeloyl-ACP methyl ester carboxylesterase